MEIAKNHKLKVIEDAAHALVFIIKINMLNYGDIGVLSYYDKTITTAEGGMILTNVDNYKKLL